MMVAVTASTFATAIVAVLGGLFALLLAASFRRARISRTYGPRPAPGADGRNLRAGPQGSARVLSRRDFFRGSLLASLGVFAAQFGGTTLAFLWPNLKRRFGSQITLTDPPDAILQQVVDRQQPYYLGAGRFYLISYTGDGDEPGGIYEGITAEVPGFPGRLMAIYQKCAHLGCRVPFCQQSQWFECPCHGSKYNYAGEYELGPAPTGMFRFPVKVEGDRVVVDTGTVTAGPPRGTDTIHESPRGPFCVA